jgi:hypothetical protein
MERSCDNSSKRSLDMRGVAKSDLPSKTCPACGREFTWRKKWERDWENVRYCSERCKRSGPAVKSAQAKTKNR